MPGGGNDEGGSSSLRPSLISTLTLWSQFSDQGTFLPNDVQSILFHFLAGTRVEMRTVPAGGFWPGS